MPSTTMPTTSMPSTSMPGAPPLSTATPPIGGSSSTSNANAAGAPVAGANSFTMTQAKKRMEDQGYSQVGELKKDDKSVWRGQAMKDGKSVNVALDYQGNVTMN
ncbi:MAG: PepSY domain-containing protein [Acetobacteraceae bacterium]|nr:PepSY domain-containing protein [Acetobacteraceae bacterium]